MLSKNILHGLFVGSLVVLFYGVSTLFGSFNISIKVSKNQFSISIV